MSNPYTVQLLNDLHNHFPELLYNHQRFQSGADILNYVNSIVRLTPAHQTYHYYQQQYHAYYHPEHARRVIDDLYMPPPASYPPASYPPASYPPSPASPPVATAAVAAPPSLQDLLNADDDDMLPRLYGGHTSMNRSYRSLGSTAAAPATAAVPATAAIRAPYSLVQDNPSTSIRIRRVSEFIPLSNISVSAIFNQIMQDALPANLHELLEDVPVIPTEDDLRNNTSVSRLEEDIDDNCAICQDPLLTNHDVRTINHCEHMFHKQCIDTWFGRHIHCPCCRHDVREP
jgi:hypothetical protein